MIPVGVAAQKDLSRCPIACTIESVQTALAEWYYIGHYGQLGPLTHEQIQELVSGGVIVRETFVWRTGMSDWLPASRLPELQASFVAADPYVAPPPPPAPSRQTTTTPQQMTMDGWRNDVLAPAHQGYPAFGPIRSDRNRVMAGVLNLIFPGVGRIYLGHYAHGVLQLVLSPCGIGYVWSVVDGIIILSGGVKYDGYGRVLAE